MASRPGEEAEGNGGGWRAGEEGRQNPPYLHASASPERASRTARIYQLNFHDTTLERAQKVFSIHSLVVSHKPQNVIQCADAYRAVIGQRNALT